MLKHDLSISDREFRAAFEAGAFAPANFSHRAHVQLAYVYLAESDVDMALERMRAGGCAQRNEGGARLCQECECSCGASESASIAASVTCSTAAMVVVLVSVAAPAVASAWQITQIVWWLSAETCSEESCAA